MNSEGRKITKIAREISKVTVQAMHDEGIGTAEFDFIHLIRHQPGVTQAQICEQLHIDKSAAARRTARLEEKGYLTRSPDPNDRRSAKLYPTEKAENLKESKAIVESICYEWLLEQLSPEERKTFLQLLDKVYLCSKKERQQGFPHMKTRLEEAAR